MIISSYDVITIFYVLDCSMICYLIVTRGISLVIRLYISVSSSLLIRGTSFMYRVYIWSDSLLPWITEQSRAGSISDSTELIERIIMECHIKCIHLKIFSWKWEDQSFFKKSILMAHAESWGQNVTFFVDQLVLYLPGTSCQHFSVGKVDPKVWQNISEISRTAQMSSSITEILEVN